MKKSLFKSLYLSLVCMCLCAIAVTFLSFAYTNIDVNADSNISFNDSSYTTAGASVRLLEKSGTKGDVDESGIRFHVLLNKELYVKHKDNPNFKTYTAIIPVRLLSGDLNFSTANALILETTKVWKTYVKDSSFLESVAYVYGLPNYEYSTELVFRGLISFDGGNTISEQTEVSTRCMAYVAKSARDDANAVLPDATLEKERVDALNTYIPRYNLVYQVGNTTTSEALEYGDKIKNQPNGVSIWKDVNGNTFDLSNALTFNNVKNQSVQDIVLTAYANVTVSTTNATATVNGTTVTNGSTIEVKCGTLNIDALPNTNYYVSSMTVDGSNKGAVSSYSLTVTKNVSISIVASIITHSVSLNNAGGATITGSINGTYNTNSTCSFSLGKGFYKVTVNGTEIFPSANGIYSFKVTATSEVKIVKYTDAETKAKILNLIANTPGTNLYVSGNNLLSPQNTSTITIPQAVFDELKKYGYTSISFDIYKEQPKEILYKKRIQNITTGETVAECRVNQASISASVTLFSAASLQGQYKSWGSWGEETVDVNWTLSNISFN